MDLAKKLKKLDTQRAEIAAEIEEQQERQRIEVGGHIVPLLNMDAGLAERLLSSPALSGMPARGQRFVRAYILTLHPHLATATDAAQAPQVQGSRNSALAS